MSLRKDVFAAGCCCGRAGTGRHSGGFLLRIMPPSWHPVPACTPRLRCRRAVLNCSSDDAAAIRKSGLEIMNRCSLWAVLEGFLASIPKSGLEIKNRCTHESVNGKNLASIRKSGPEIKNRCTNQPIFSTHPQHIPPARVHHALTTRLALDVLHGDSDAGSTVAAKAGADAPGGGISLCFCRRGCAAPAQKAATKPPLPRDNPTLQQKSPAEKDQPDY